MDRSRLESLLHRGRLGDADALAVLVDAYSPRVFGLLYRMTGSRDAAEDLLQETFLRLVRALHTYEHGDRFEPYLFRIAANLARDHVRRRKRRGVMTSLEAGADADESGIDVATRARCEPDADLIRGEAREQLEHALAGLPDADREILLLRHFSELAFREIAEMLGVPLGTARARAHRALRRLKGELERGGIEDAD